MMKTHNPTDQRLATALGSYIPQPQPQAPRKPQLVSGPCADQLKIGGKAHA